MLYIMRFLGTLKSFWKSINIATDIYIISGYNEMKFGLTQGQEQNQEGWNMANMKTSG